MIPVFFTQIAKEKLFLQTVCIWLIYKEFYFFPSIECELWIEYMWSFISHSTCLYYLFISQNKFSNQCVCELCFLLCRHCWLMQFKIVSNVFFFLNIFLLECGIVNISFGGYCIVLWSFFIFSYFKYSKLNAETSKRSMRKSFYER